VWKQLSTRSSLSCERCSVNWSSAAIACVRVHPSATSRVQVTNHMISSAHHFTFTLNAAASLKALIWKMIRSLELLAHCESS
jgi:hypothetical protein